MRIFVIILLFFLTDCAVQVPPSVKKTPVKFDSNVSIEFGPFFIPANNSLNSISINYFTKDKQKTSIYFSMVGDLDWLRYDNELSSYHKMIFRDLEENAVYQFRINSRSEKLLSKSLIKTVPYGSDYQFDFALSSMDSHLEIEKSPHFMILLSEKKVISEKDFIPFYNANKKIISSTIIVPLFDLSINKNLISLSEDGFYCLKYKSANIILVYKDFKDTDKISNYLSQNIDDRNYIVAGPLDPDVLRRIAEQYRTKVEAIYTIKREDEGLKNIRSIDKYEWITIANKNNFALKN